MVALRKLLRETARSKQHSSHNMLISVVTGSSWTASRLARAGRGAPPHVLPMRCGRHHRLAYLLGVPSPGPESECRGSKFPALAAQGPQCQDEG